MTYGKFLFLIVLCVAVATPFMMKHRNAQATAAKVKLYCDTAPVEAARDGVDCVLYKRKLPTSAQR